MTKSHVLLSMAAAVLLASPAFAASTSTTTTSAAPAAGASTTLTLPTADQTKLKTWIMMQNTASVAAPAGVSVAVGSTLPASIMLHPIQASAGVTTVAMDQYAVIDNKIVLVNPTDRKILYVFS